MKQKNHDITDSIKYAKNIQEALLPPLQNLHKELKDAFVLYLPKDIVSGDFYWFAKRNNLRFIASVDCTGHGVPGAFTSIIGNTLLNEIVTEKNITSPAEILNELHVGVKTALKQSIANNTHKCSRNTMSSTIHRCYKAKVVAFCKPIKISTHNVFWQIQHKCIFKLFMQIL